MAPKSRNQRWWGWKGEESWVKCEHKECVKDPEIEGCDARIVAIRESSVSKSGTKWGLFGLEDDKRL